MNDDIKDLRRTRFGIILCVVTGLALIGLILIAAPRGDYCETRSPDRCFQLRLDNAERQIEQQLREQRRVGKFEV